MLRRVISHRSLISRARHWDDASSLQYIREGAVQILFQLSDRDLTFAKALEVAIETESPAQEAKKAAYWTKTKAANQVYTDTASSQSRHEYSSTVNSEKK